jgi:hypothetical protein
LFKREEEHLERILKSRLVSYLYVLIFLTPDRIKKKRKKSMLLRRKSLESILKKEKASRVRDI